MRKLVITLLLLSTVGLNALTPGKNQITVRGRQQTLFYYPASGSPRGTVLFTPGDGGWRGLAIDMGKSLADSGYDVVGFQVKEYLASFTSDTSGVSPDQLGADYDALLSALPQHGNKPILVGWSEGAAISLLAASDPRLVPRVQGLLLIGLPERGILGWRWRDTVTWVTKTLPDEPQFASADYLPRLQVPSFTIHSTHDEYTTGEMARKLNSLIRARKQFLLLDASNHRFDGATQKLFSAMAQGLAWIQR